MQVTSRMSEELEIRKSLFFADDLYRSMRVSGMMVSAGAYHLLADKTAALVSVINAREFIHCHCTRTSIPTYDLGKCITVIDP